jgi:hypothetical protein
MKPFVINRRSWHYKFNQSFFNEHGFSMERNWEPHHSNFCAYWRATMFRLLWALALLVVAISILAVLGHAAYTDPVSTLIAVASIVGAITLLVLAATIGAWLEGRKYKETNSDGPTKPESLLAQRYRAYKHRICPTVSFDK